MVKIIAGRIRRSKRQESSESFAALARWQKK